MEDNFFQAINILLPKLEERKRQIEEDIIILREAQKAKEVLERWKGLLTPPSQSVQVRPSRGPVLKDACYKVLRDTGHPLQIADIAKVLMTTRGLNSKDYRPLYKSIHAALNEDRRICRLKKGQYGLTEWLWGGHNFLGK
jgi:hypothetical protein